MHTVLVADHHVMRATIMERIALFRKNPDDTRLANHALHGRMDEKWAFSITDDIRIVYTWIGNTTVRFLAIGTHEEVYGKKAS